MSEQLEGYGFQTSLGARDSITMKQAKVLCPGVCIYRWLGHAGLLGPAGRGNPELGPNLEGKPSFSEYTQNF